MTKKEIIEKYGEEEYRKYIEEKKQYYQQHREEIKQHYQQHREEKKQYQKQYREQHKEEIKQYQKQYKRQYREQHIEEYREEMKQYYQQHREEYREKMKQYGRKSRAMFAYCIPEQIEQIENYKLAKAYNFNGWHIHHRLETHNSDGEKRLVNLSREELIALDMYYNRPANELVFLTASEHMKLHRNNKANTERP